MASNEMNQEIQPNEEVKTSNWKGFGKSIFSAFIITFIWAIVGCNFMFLQKYVADGQDYLGKLFPDDPHKSPYWDESNDEPRIVRDFKESGLKTIMSLKAKRDALKAKMPSSAAKRSSAAAGTQPGKPAVPPVNVPKQSAVLPKVTEKTPLLSAVDYEGGASAAGKSMFHGGAANVESTVDPRRVAFFNKLANLDKYSTPYSWKTGEAGLFGDFKAWIGDSVEFSYVNGRGLINKMLEGGDMVSDSLSPALVLLLSVPLLGILLSVTPFYGFLSTLVGEFQAPNNGWVWALVFLFLLGFDFILASFVGFWQTLQVFFTFLVLPLLVNASNVFSIMGEHYAFFTGMFGLMVVSNAFAFLRIEASMVMLLTYLYLVWKTWKN